jgi:hypothetical protein
MAGFSWRCDDNELKKLETKVTGLGPMERNNKSSQASSWTVASSEKETECCFGICSITLKTKLHCLSPRANYTDRATAACRRSDCQLVRIRRCHLVSVTDPSGRISRFSRQEPLLFYQVAPQFVLTRLECTPFQTHYIFLSGSAGNRTRASGSVAKNSDR